MPTKCTMLFNTLSAASDPTAPVHRTGGFSESFYKVGGSPTEIRDAFETLCQVRARLLPTSFAVVGQRYQQVAPIGPSNSTGRIFPGSAALQADIPQMALLCTCRALATRNSRRLKIRGIPDARVIEGEYSPAATFTANLTRYFIELGNWFFRGKDLAQIHYPVFTANNPGAGGADNVVTREPTTFAVGDFVSFFRTFDNDDELIEGTYRVTQLISGTSIFKLEPALSASYGIIEGGSIRREGSVFPQIDFQSISPQYIITQKVGAPFIRYRGRVSARRA